MLILQIDQTQHDLEREFLTRGLNDKSVKIYYRSMVGSATILKANKERARKDMKEALEFEMKLANVWVRTITFYHLKYSSHFLFDRFHFLEKSAAMVLHFIIHSL